MYMELESLNSETHGLLNTTSYTQWTFSVKKANDLFLFPLFPHLPLTLSTLWCLIFSVASLSVIDLIPLYVRSDVTQASLDSPKTRDSKFTLLLISFSPSSHSSRSLAPNLISQHLVQGNSSCQQGPEFTVETPTQVAFCWNRYCF